MLTDRETNLIAVLGTAIADQVTLAVTLSSGLTGAAPAALAALLAEPGMSVDSLARTVRITGSGGVRLVDRLAAEGLLERRGGRDARTVSLWLTGTGRAEAKRVLAARRDAIEELVSGLDDAGQAALAGLAERLLGQVTTDRTAADQLCRLCDVAACESRGCPVEEAVT